MNIVVTGDLNNFSRDAFKEFVEKNGGKVTGSASAYTNFVVTNYPNSLTEKIKKAAEAGIPIISEADFENIIKN